MLLKSELRAALRNPTDISANVKRVNTRLNKMLPTGKFASTFMMLMDDRDRKITYCKCSQEPGLIFNPRGLVSELHSNGILLGSFGPELLGDDFEFECKTVQLEKGEKIVLYTDGITEAMNPKREEFGLEGIERLVHENGTGPVNRLVNIIEESVHDFQQGLEPEDDLTLVALRVQPA